VLLFTKKGDGIITEVGGNMDFTTKKFVMEKDYPLSRETVWNLLSDTDRLNRIIGLFSVKFKPANKLPGKTFYREALAKVGGIVPLIWKEYPFQWNKYENYMVERFYEGGPLQHFRGGVELEDTELVLPDGSKGTKVRLIGEFTPRNLLGIGAVQFTGIQSMKNTMKYVDDYLEAVQTEKPLPSDVSLKVKVNLEKLNILEGKLAGMSINPTYIEKLHQFLITSDNSDVTKMRPLELAKKWDLDEQEVIRLFLYATKVGIMNLSWNLICPNCRVSKVEYSSLNSLEQKFHCDLCGINYNANFGKYVELNFAIHPAIRIAYDNLYCVGGPMISPHIVTQQVIERGQQFKLKIPRNPKDLRVRILQVNHILTLQSSASEVSKPIVMNYTDDGFAESEMRFSENVNSMLIVNESSADIVLVVEKTEWNPLILTAAKVTSMQEFRDLFSSEVLSPGQQVGIENVTILFSDLLGSTSLYELIGDAEAYGQVRRHFDFLTQWIGKNSGGVVKTIGDAVMAVFHLPEDALNAAIQIQQHVNDFNEGRRDPIVLKIGLYSGPAIAVNSNDRLDYFGRTVNIAARIQGKSDGNDIVFSEDYLNNEIIQSLFTANNAELEPFSANLKGIDENMKLVRMHVSK
jgi:class 3 adenylate cyclase